MDDGAVGLSAKAVERYAREWILAIRDVSPLAHAVRDRVAAGDVTGAQALAPEETRYPVVTGQIEAAVKQVLNLRLNRNGAWWTTRNAERMLALRAARILGRLDEVWRRRIARRCKEVPAPLVALTTSAQSPELLVACLSKADARRNLRCTRFEA